MTKSTRRVRNDLRWGIQFGLLLGSILVAWATLVYLLNGSRPFVDHGVSWASVSGAYLISALVCGAVLGAVRPHLTSAFRSILFGPVVTFPFLVIFASLADSPFWTWDMLSWTIWAAGSVILGAPTGGIYWFMFTRGSR